MLLLLLPLLLAGCEWESEVPKVADLSALDPWVAVALILRLPLCMLALAVTVKGFVLVHREGDYTVTESTNDDEEDEA